MASRAASIRWRWGDLREARAAVRSRPGIDRLDDALRRGIHRDVSRLLRNPVEPVADRRMVREVEPSLAGHVGIRVQRDRGEASAAPRRKEEDTQAQGSIRSLRVACLPNIDKIAPGCPVTRSIPPSSHWPAMACAPSGSAAPARSSAFRDRRTFQRRIREFTGTAPGDWLARQRIAHARHLAETTNLTVERTAAHSGFGAAGTLRHHFRRLVGTTPTAYRRTFHRMDRSSPGEPVVGRHSPPAPSQ